MTALCSFREQNSAWVIIAVMATGAEQCTDGSQQVSVRVYLLRAVSMSVAAVASRPEVGSSMNSSEGLDTNSSPMLTLLRCPPLQTAHKCMQLRPELAHLCFLQVSWLHRFVHGVMEALNS